MSLREEWLLSLEAMPCCNPEKASLWCKEFFSQKMTDKKKSNTKKDDKKSFQDGGREVTDLLHAGVVVLL